MENSKQMRKALYLNKLFKNTSIEMRKFYFENYNIILTSPLHREFLFFNVYNKLSPKEYLIVRRLLEESDFDVVKNAKLNFKKVMSSYGFKSKKLTNYKGFIFSLNEVKKYKHKIKKKILKNAEEQHILLDNFEKEFDTFMYADISFNNNLYNLRTDYELDYNQRVKKLSK